VVRSLRLDQVPDATGTPTTARSGRCANHPAVAGIGACELCGRSLCVACAVPVRGRVIGPECLSTLLEDAPPPAAPPALIHPRGDGLAIAGFGLVIVLSLFPWSRFGDSSHFLGAWTLHWSLVAVVAALVGMAFAVFVWRRPLDGLLEALTYVWLGLIVGGAALLHHRHPPPLSVGSAVPWLAALGAGLAILGGVWKGASLLLARRALS
jgi:hypothetical protein